MSGTNRRASSAQGRFAMAAAGIAAAAFAAGAAIATDAMPNACPVDGCEVSITNVKSNGEEIEITLDANFQPDVSKNHIHVWWGESYTVEQAGRNAEPVHGVPQGRWHRHDDFPTYVTQGAASTGAREGAKTLCVSAADRNHNILDVGMFHCVDVSSLLPGS